MTHVSERKRFRSRRPKTHTTTFTARVDTSIIGAVRAVCSREEIPLSDVATEAMILWLKEKGFVV